MKALESYEPWRNEAACHDSTEVDFFSEEPGEQTRARAMCGGCPVIDECLQYAIDTNQTEGVWGGLLPRERNRLRRIWLRDLKKAG